MLLKPVVYVSTIDSRQFSFQVSKPCINFFSHNRIISLKVEEAMPAVLGVTLPDIDTMTSIAATLIKNDVFEMQNSLKRMQKIARRQLILYI